MSGKRQATTDLNHENWDQEDTSEQKEMGQFKSASKDILEKRVIRTAKRRTQVSNEPTKSVFSGFGGFNKTQPSSFEFLANLTNGNKNTNGLTGTSSNIETSATSTLFSNKASSPSGGLFGTPASATPAKSLGLTTSPFGAGVETSPSAQMFTVTKTDSTVNESPFKIQSVSSADSNAAKLTSSSTPLNTPNMFGVSSTSANDSKTLFSSTNSTPFKIQPLTSTTTAMVQTSFGVSSIPAVSSNIPEKKVEEKPNEKKLKYYSKLKGLNESVSDWISKHVAQTPLCILSPIFKDYEKYLKEITEEYQGEDKEESNKKMDDTAAPEAKSEIVTFKSGNGSDIKSPFGINNSGSTLFSGSPSDATSKPAVFGAQNNLASTGDNKPQTFSFGIKTSVNNTSTTTTTSTGFSFGVTTSTLASSPFTNTNTTSNQSNTAPFSFGIGKPFSFSSNNVQQPSAEPATTENTEDEPPKVEYTPVKEDNSVYEKKCKIFVKKEANFADKGVGTLYVKKIEESGKHQLLVRANTNLGTVLLNLVLASAIPTQRMGKNNVMLVCIPTPDAKPPPTPVLIRVKTGEEADELLETLNKYKG